MWLRTNIQGMKQAWGGQWRLGILRGDSGGTNKLILRGEAPNIALYLPQSPALKIPRFHCPPVACFIPWIFIQSHIVQRPLKCL